jgi:hypothetical protein
MKIDLTKLPDRDISTVTGGTSNQQSQSTPSFWNKFSQNWVGGLGLGDKAGLLSPTIGAGKGVLSTISGMSELGQRGLKAVTPTMKSTTTGETINQPIAKIPEKYTESSNYGESTGKALEQMAEYFIPGAIGKTLMKPEQLAGIMAKGGTIADIVKAMVGEAASAGVVATAQEGELGPKTAIAATAGALSVPVGKVLEWLAPKFFSIGAHPEGKDWKAIDQNVQDAVGKYVGTKKMIVNQAKQTIKEESAKMDDLVTDPILTKGKGITREELVTEATKHAEDVGQVHQGSANTMKKYIKSFVDTGKIGDIGVQEYITPEGAWKLKQKFGKLLSTIFKTGKETDPNVAAEKQAMLQI